MRRFDSAVREQLDERLGVGQIAGDPHPRLGGALARRRRERNPIALGARGTHHQMTDVARSDEALTYRTSSICGEFSRGIRQGTAPSLQGRQ